MDPMDDDSTAKYVITQPKPGFVPNFFGPPAQHVEARDVAYMDGEVVEGGHYVETCWFFTGSDEIAVHPHTHDFDEVLAFIGNNPDDLTDLGGQVEQTIGGETHILTKSCVLLVPAGMVHGPLVIRRVDRPFFHFATGYTALYHGEKV
jgi:hypothetical protein